MELTSPEFQNGSPIPRRHGYKEKNTNPPLAISGIPDAAKSLAIIMDDPDAMAPAGKVWVHWTLWNLNPDTASIPEDSVPEEAIQGMTDFGQSEYGGPAPPDKQHTYIFKAYALDTTLDTKAGSSKTDLEKSMADHILDTATLTGTYKP